MTDPCETTSISGPITTDMKISVFGELEEVYIDPGIDSVSLFLGDK